MDHLAWRGVNAFPESRTLAFPRALAATALALGLLALLAGCVVIPYRPESETKHDLAEVPNPEKIRLSVGPRSFLEEMGDELQDEDERIELVDGQTFIDTAAPDGELSLARLLQPSTRALIEPLQADYLVLFGEPHDETLSDWGGVATWIGFYGLGKERASSTYWAALVDLREMKIVRQLTTTSTGTDAGVGLFYGIFVVSDTSGSAQKGVIRNLAGTLAAAKPEGSLRLVLLAKEPLLTPQDVARQARVQELEARRATGGLALLRMDAGGGDLVDLNPPFSEPAPPGEGDGLVYLYRPKQTMGGLFPLSIRVDRDALDRSRSGDRSHGQVGTEEIEVTRLVAGGYYPYRVKAGPLRLWVENDPEESLHLDVQSGRTYFVRGSTRMGWKHPHGELSLVEEAEARPAVIVCRLLPSMREYVAAVRKLAEQGYAYEQLELARFHSIGVSYAEDEALLLDRVESYKWYTVVLESDGVLEWMRERAQTDRDLLAASMTAEEVTEGSRRGREWLAAFEAAFLGAPSAVSASEPAAPQPAPEPR